MVDIFVSYASEDRARVQPLAKSLEEQGWSVFWDRTIPAGKTWREVIGDALKNARSVIVAWSKTSVESRWVQEEAERGLKRNVLIPILIDDVEPPLGFGTIQAADLINWDPTQSSLEFEKLIADISAILGPSPRKAKEAEQAAEEQRRQEEERKRKEGERRKAEEESQRLEIEKRRIAEEKRRFEEQQRAELERKEIEAKRKVEEELKRKEAEEQERARKAEAQRRAEEESKLKPSVPEKADAIHVETKNADVKRLHTKREVSKPIAAVRTRPLWLPILLTSFGWAVSGPIAGVAIDLGVPIQGAVQGAIIGAATVIALRQTVPGIQWKLGSFVIIGWAITKTISWAISSAVRSNLVPIISNSVGGLVTVIALRQIVPGIQWKLGFFVTIGWAISSAISWGISWAIGGALYNVILNAFGRDTGSHIYYAISRAITGALGGGVMFYLLNQAKRHD